MLVFVRRRALTGNHGVVVSGWIKIKNVVAEGADVCIIADDTRKNQDQHQKHSHSNLTISQGKPAL